MNGTCPYLQLDVLGHGDVGLLGHGDGLAREGRLLDADDGGLERQQAQVGGNLITHVQLHHVAGHQLTCRQVGDLCSAHVV